MSADIVQFLDYQSGVTGYGIVHIEPATVIILPVVRIERNPDDPAAGPGRYRRRRSAKVGD